MCDNLSVLSQEQVPAKYTCKPGHGSPNNTDAICTPNSFKSSDSNIITTNIVGDKGVKFDNCCNNVVNPNLVVESRNHLSSKCMN
jgi:hypothetical protein